MASNTSVILQVLQSLKRQQGERMRNSSIFSDQGLQTPTAGRNKEAETMRTGIVRKCMPALALAGAILLSLPPRADALLQTSASVGGVIVAACDNNPPVCGPAGAIVVPDIDDRVGVLSTEPFSVGAISAEFAVQTSAKSSGEGGLNTLSSSGTVVQNTGAVAIPILFSISDTNFLGPAIEFTVTGSGTWVDTTLPAAFGGSMITMQWFNDPANAQGADTPLDTPGIRVNTATDTPQDGISNQSFGGPGTAFNATGAVSDPALFSMTLFNDLVLGPGIRLESRGQAESKPQQEVPQVPAPAALLLLGSALGLLGWRHWKSPA
jgi:hypothetical protein